MIRGRTKYVIVFVSPFERISIFHIIPGVMVITGLLSTPPLLVGKTPALAASNVLLASKLLGF